jgi:hypothetical protein
MTDQPGKTLRDWQAEIHDVNASNGWHDTERTFGEGMALLHSEVSEAFEAWRDWGLEPSHAYGGAQSVERSCNCGRTLAPQYFEWRHSQEMTQHEAEAVKAWLMGGGA